VTGAEVVALARTRIGQAYVLGSIAPKDDAGWAGPWDCAEFASWLVYQATARLFGCASNTAKPAQADAWTGYWTRDAATCSIPVADALSTAGAFLLRSPPAQGVPGHIAISDGKGGTVEAASRTLGVIAGTALGRRWDMGVVVPGVAVVAGPALAPQRSAAVVLRVGDKGQAVSELQRALGIAADGIYGIRTAQAVAAYQAAHGLVADGEAGALTRAALTIDGGSSR